MLNNPNKVFKQFQNHMIEIEDGNLLNLEFNTINLN